MKKFEFALLIATMLLVGCGTGTLTDPTGSWTVTLTPTQTPDVGAATAMAFTDTLATQASTTVTNGSYSPVTATNLSVTTSNGCIDNGASQRAQYAVSGAQNQFAMSVVSTPDSKGVSNTLAMMGVLNSDNTITGNWFLSPSVYPPTGVSSCAGSGTFMMKLASGTGFNHRGS